jgi:hypothetical protein
LITHNVKLELLLLVYEPLLAMVRINVRNRTPATRSLKTHLKSNGGAHGKVEIKKKLQIHRKVRLSQSGIYFQVGAVKYTATMFRDIDCDLLCLISHTEARFAAEM